MRMYGVILAGGRGTRFWPYSRAARPKQFLDLTGRGSMLAVTVRRLAGMIPPERIFVLTHEDLVPLIREELPRIPARNIFAEPVGRNTAPSIAVASLLVTRSGGDEPFLTCPADHTIRDVPRFRKVVRAAARLAARRDVLVTFGVVPSYPATGYGYIEAGSPLPADGGGGVRRVRAFHEKPPAARAAAYVRSGRHYWNSGIFLWRPSVYLAAWSRCLPRGRAPLAAIDRALGTKAERRVVARSYPTMPGISVDYGVLEKASNVVVAPADVGWSDVGSWDAVFGLLRADRRGNAGPGPLELVDCRGSLFFNPEGTTAAIGVEDTIVVVEGKSVLVCKRGESQRVREIIERLKKGKRTDLL
jgi:mannose-1-phosphate guanylyltransferase